MLLLYIYKPHNFIPKHSVQLHHN